MDKPCFDDTVTVVPIQGDEVEEDGDEGSAASTWWSSVSSRQTGDDDDDDEDEDGDGRDNDDDVCTTVASTMVDGSMIIAAIGWRNASDCCWSCDCSTMLWGIDGDTRAVMDASNDKDACKEGDDDARCLRRGRRGCLSSPPATRSMHIAERHNRTHRSPIAADQTKHVAYVTHCLIDWCHQLTWSCTRAFDLLSIAWCTWW